MIKIRVSTPLRNCTVLCILVSTWLHLHDFTVPRRLQKCNNYNNTAISARFGSAEFLNNQNESRWREDKQSLKLQGSCAAAVGVRFCSSDVIPAGRGASERCPAWRDPQPRKMWERVPWEEVAGGRFSILSSKLARATTLSNVSGANFFLGR